MVDPDLETVGRVLEGSKLYIISALFVLASSCSPILAKATFPCTYYSGLPGAVHSISTFSASLSSPIVARATQNPCKCLHHPVLKVLRHFADSEAAEALGMHACILLLECSHMAAIQLIIPCSSALGSLLSKCELTPAGSNASLENALHPSFPAPPAGWRPAMGLYGCGATHCWPSKGHCPDCSQ